MKFLVRENIPACEIKKYLPPQFVGLYGRISHSTAPVNLIVFQTDRKSVVTGRYAEKAFARISDKTLVTHCFASGFSSEAQDIICANNGKVYSLFSNVIWGEEQLFRFKNGEF